MFFFSSLAYLLHPTFTRQWSDGLTKSPQFARVEVFKKVQQSRLHTPNVCYI
jgi:hypothetical protein